MARTVEQDQILTEIIVARVDLALRSGNRAALPALFSDRGFSSLAANVAARRAGLVARRSSPELGPAAIARIDAEIAEIDALDLTTGDDTRSR